MVTWGFLHGESYMTSKSIITIGLDDFFGVKGKLFAVIVSSFPPVPDDVIVLGLGIGLGLGLGSRQHTYGSSSASSQYFSYKRSMSR